MNDANIADIRARLKMVEDSLEKHLNSCQRRYEKMDGILHRIDTRLEADQAVRESKSEDHARRFNTIRLMFAATSILLGIPATAATIYGIAKAIGG